MLWLGKIGLKKTVLERKEYKICFLRLLLKPVFPLQEVCRTGRIYVFIELLQNSLPHGINDYTRMKALVLKEPRSLGLCERNDPETGEDEALVRVVCCSVCRTDAKMWQSGHRDLVMPRVLGHEISGYLDNERVAVWPGISCGSCAFCLAGRENLCASMQILGFHHDGGFAEYVAVRRTSLLSVPDTLPMELAALAEPLGCALHGLDRAWVRSGERVLIYGAGSLGLFLALGAAERGAHPVVIEPDGRKLRKSHTFRDRFAIGSAETPSVVSGLFDAAFNAASVPSTLDGLRKLRSGGRYCLFSGLQELPESAASLFAGLHYRELQLLGSYGCTRASMASALAMLERFGGDLAFMVERKLPIEQLEAAMPDVIGGKYFKMVVQF